MTFLTGPLPPLAIRPLIETRCERICCQNFAQNFNFLVSTRVNRTNGETFLKTCVKFRCDSTSHFVPVRALSFFISQFFSLSFHQDETRLSVLACLSELAVTDGVRSRRCGVLAALLEAALDTTCPRAAEAMIHAVLHQLNHSSDAYPALQERYSCSGDPTDVSGERRFHLGKAKKERGLVRDLLALISCL